MSSKLKLTPRKKARDVSAIMRRVSSAGTTPEVIFRKALIKAGIRIGTGNHNLPGKPDFVFRSRKLAIFIDGDLWHGNQWRVRGQSCLEDQFKNTSSRSYWVIKIRRNMQRDCNATTELMSMGWTVLRFWESQIHSELEWCVKTTVRTMESMAMETSQSLLPKKLFAEFFAGVGLMRLGLERQGWTVSFANDIDPHKQKMYAGHFDDEDEVFLSGDIHKLAASQVPSVTLATASFPCNDLSLAGARRGIKAGHSSSFWGFVRILEDLGERRPPIVLLENVPGFLTSHQGRDLRDALISLNQLGYGVDCFILDALNFVPQSRKRLFVVGVLRQNREHAEEFTLIPDIESDVRPKPLVDFILHHPELWWVIRDLPNQPRHQGLIEEILEDIPDSAAEWWSQERADYLLDQMSPKHRTQADRMIANPFWSYGTVFRRMRNGHSMAELRWDGVAGCLRTPRGGSGRQIIFKAGNGKYSARLLTPREAARLMGADDFTISVPINQALFGFGDAVCVPVIEWIAKYYLNPLVNELIHSKPLSAAKGA